MYNLGILGNGPWDDYANLLTEVDRLPLKPRGTIAIWNLYAGALLRPCPGIFDKRELPWRTGLGTLKGSFKDFRERSPLGLLLPRLWSRTPLGKARPDPDILVRRFPNGAETLFQRWDRAKSHLSLGEIRNHPYYGCVGQTLVALKNFARSKNISLGILVAPTKDQVYPWLLAGGPPWSAPSGPSGAALAVREICGKERTRFWI